MDSRAIAMNTIRRVVPNCVKITVHQEFCVAITHAFVDSAIQVLVISIASLRDFPSPVEHARSTQQLVSARTRLKSAAVKAVRQFICIQQVDICNAPIRISRVLMLRSLHSCHASMEPQHLHFAIEFASHQAEALVFAVKMVHVLADLRLRRQNVPNCRSSWEN